MGPPMGNGWEKLKLLAWRLILSPPDGALASKGNSEAQPIEFTSTRVTNGTDHYLHVLFLSD